MSKRWYFADVIGTGTDEDPKRTALDDIPGVATVALMVPGQTWALVLVATKNHALLANRPGVDQLPDFPLDGKLNAINQIAYQRMTDAIQRRGIPVSLAGSDGYRGALNAIGRVIDVTFDVDAYNVSEPA